MPWILRHSRGELPLFEARKHKLGIEHGSPGPKLNALPTNPPLLSISHMMQNTAEPIFVAILIIFFFEAVSSEELSSCKVGLLQ